MHQVFFARSRRMLAALAVAVLAGCGPVVGAGIPGVAQIEALTVVGTEKTIADHLISYSSGKDCSYVYVEKGNRYCKEDEPQIKPQVYCYNTLAGATCYARPDPFGNGQRELGNNEHNMATSKKPR